MSVAHETAREPKPQEPQQSSHWREMGFGGVTVSGPPHLRTGGALCDEELQQLAADGC